ncbi:MAG: S26 family signal peptidase [Thermoplasmata archaeon]|nr:S26 family signal peptidase [Thermoplasmata archaeon]RLF30059.1 MAG: S26 family signal peptidase [Thermoplasmata archaeon]
MFKDIWHRFWHTKEGHIPVIRDIVIAFLILLTIMVSLWGYTGQPFPQAPLVVIESGSMMHKDASFGKLHTIDPGDLVLVVAVHSKADIITYGEAKNGEKTCFTYGSYGDVLIYRPDTNGDGSISDYIDKDRTPIIHRAMCWVEYNKDTRLYTVKEYGIINATSITIEELGLENYKPKWSGFITKGDNNPVCDQSNIYYSPICPQPVPVSHIIGKARGEIPWFGLIKLAFFGNNVEPQEGWTTILFATAPTDCWICLGICLLILILIPFSLDIYDYLKKKKD